MGLPSCRGATGIFTGTTLPAGRAVETKVQIIAAFMRVRTYLTRNFATLGFQLRGCWPFTGLQFTAFALLTFPAPGRRQLAHVIFRFSTNPVFLVNSCLGLFSADHEHPLFRRFWVNLPSSLTTLLPLALESSSYLPVSVCGTGTLDIHAAFLASYPAGLRY